MTHRLIAVACAAALALLSLRVASSAPVPRDAALLHLAVSARNDVRTGLLAVPTFLSSHFTTQLSP